MKNFLSKIWFGRYFSGSLAVWKECGEAVALAIPRRVARGEDEKSFELYSIYTASQDLANFLSPRASLRLGARLLIYIDFEAEKKIAA